MAKKIKIITIFALSLCILGCIDASLQRSLKEIRDQNNAIIQYQGEIKEQNNSLIRTTKEIHNHGTIKYGGSGWVIVGICIVIIIFLTFTCVVLYYLFIRKNAMLGLVTTAVHKCNHSTRDMVKSNIRLIASNEIDSDHAYNEADMKRLSEFVKKEGVDA